MQDLEKSVNLTCVTDGNLNLGRHLFDPESDQMELTLTVKDPSWQPRLGLRKWDPTSRTFTEVSH